MYVQTNGDGNADIAFAIIASLNVMSLVVYVVACIQAHKYGALLSLAVSVMSL